MKGNNNFTLKVIEAYSLPFQKFVLQNGEKLKEVMKGNGVKEQKEKAIKEFILIHYAFERNVSVPYYKWKAIELLNQYWNVGKPKSKEIWRKFCKGAPKLEKDTKKRKKGDPKVNKNLNPLNHFSKNKFTIWKINFVDEIITNLHSKEGIISAYKCLKRINGFGKKIIPLILRDLVILLDAGINSIKDDVTVYYFLQPIDLWVKLVSDKMELAESRTETVSRIKFDSTIIGICKSCFNVVNPLLFNQGAWYLGNRVMRCRPQLENILDEKDDFKRAKALVKSGIEHDRLDAYSARDLIKDKKLRNHFNKKIKQIDERLLTFNKN